MFESAVGLLTPCTRQNGGRSVSVMLVGVTSVPDVTISDAVTLVLPRKVNCVSSAHATLRPPLSWPSSAGTLLAASAKVTPTQRLGKVVEFIVPPYCQVCTVRIASFRPNVGCSATAFRLEWPILLAARDNRR